MAMKTIGVIFYGLLHYKKRMKLSFNKRSKNFILWQRKTQDLVGYVKQSLQKNLWGCSYSFMSCWWLFFKDFEVMSWHFSFLPRWSPPRTQERTWVATQTSTATVSTLRTPSVGDERRERQSSRRWGSLWSALSTRTRSLRARRSSLCRTASTWRRRWSGSGSAIGENFPAIRGQLSTEVAAQTLKVLLISKEAEDPEG